MKIPDTVKIIGHDYKISYDPHLFRDESTGGGTSCANGLSIVLACDSLESNMAEIFLHEIIEQIKYRLQIELDHDDLSALSEGLFAVIRNNNLDFRKEDTKNAEGL